MGPSTRHTLGLPSLFFPFMVCPGHRRLLSRQLTANALRWQVLREELHVRPLWTAGFVPLRRASLRPWDSVQGLHLEDAGTGVLPLDSICRCVCRRRSPFRRGNVWSVVSVVAT